MSGTGAASMLVRALTRVPQISKMATSSWLTLKLERSMWPDQQYSLLVPIEALKV